MAAPVRICTAGWAPALLRRPARLAGPAFEIYSRRRSLHHSPPAAAAVKPKASQKPTRRVIARKPSPPPPAPPPPPPSSTQNAREEDSSKQTLSDIVAQRRLPLVGAALAAGLLGLYVSYLAVTLFKDAGGGPCPSCSGSHGSPDETATPTGRPPAQELTRATGTQFDASLDWPERLMGITRLRRRMARLATGHVLEVAVGTGRNLSLYDWDDVAAYTTTSSEDSAVAEEGRRKLRRLEKTGFKSASPATTEVTSFTGVDISGDVLEVARSKMRAAVPGGKRAIKKRFRAAWGTGPLDEQGRTEIVNAAGGRLRLIKSDAQLPLPAPPTLDATTTDDPGTQKYDTVLQTFGLCSVSRPEQVLAGLASVTRPETGRIVLLEHGRGRWDAVNRVLDRYAGRHFERFGCWWNRDIEGVVRAAADSVPGLEVVKVERPGFLQFGTMLWIELRVRAPGEEGSGGGDAARGKAV